MQYRITFSKPAELSLAGYDTLSLLVDATDAGEAQKLAYLATDHHGYLIVSGEYRMKSLEEVSE